jgi:hypothetical protein
MDANYCAYLPVRGFFQGALKPNKKALEFGLFPGVVEKKKPLE